MGSWYIRVLSKPAGGCVGGALDWGGGCGMPGGGGGGAGANVPGGGGGRMLLLALTSGISGPSGAWTLSSLWLKG